MSDVVEKKFKGWIMQAKNVRVWEWIEIKDVFPSLEIESWKEERF